MKTELAMDNFQLRTLALAGVFRAASLANTLANEGTISNQDLENSIKSIFQTDPEQVIDIFGDIDSLNIGFQCLIDQFNKDSSNRNLDMARYIVSMLFLERQLSKKPDVLETLSAGVELASRQSEHFTITHENVIANLADLYSRTISTIGPRIMINGEQHLLTSPSIANKIRVILLAGIRCAVLWQQLGGRRWHIIFSRRRYLETAQHFLEYPDKN